MAILASLPGVRVEIIVDSAPLVEYDDEETPEQPKLVSRYVEAQAGATFAVKVSVDESRPTSQDLIVFLSVDGIFIQSTFISKARPSIWEALHLDSVKTKINSDWMKQALMFQKLATSKNHDLFSFIA